MKNEGYFPSQENYNSFSKPRHCLCASAFCRSQRGSHRAQDERGREPDLPEHLPLEESLEVFDVHRDIRQFGHGMGE